MDLDFSFRTDSKVRKIPLYEYNSLVKLCQAFQPNSDAFGINAIGEFRIWPIFVL